MWEAIRQFEIDDPDDAYTFSDRLARENGWTHDYTLRVIDEYKRFVFLLCVTGISLTPSDPVDQAWHLHLLYTKSYWKDFCKNILEREIHHNPTRGGLSESSRFLDYYAKTRDIYRQYFEVDAPEDIWPNDAERFYDVDFQRVNLKKNWVLPKFPIFFRK